MSDDKVVMRMFFDGEEFQKFLKVAGNYLDSFAMIFSEDGLHVLNIDSSKITFFSKKFEYIDTEDTVVPSEPVKVVVSDLLVKVIKKFGSRGYYMLEYSEGDDYLVIGHGKELSKWMSFYRINLGIVGTGSDVDEIYGLFNDFVELKNGVGVYSFRLTTDDLSKFVKIVSMFDANITFKACSDKVEVLFVHDEKKYGKKIFSAEECELEKVNDGDVECVKTTISSSVFRHFTQLPKSYDYIITVGDGAPLFIEDDTRTFLFVMASLKE